MRFGWESEIPRPLEEVQALLEDPQAPLAWQPGLQRIDPLTGEPGRAGSVSRYVFDLNGTPYYLTETVVTDRLPEDRTVSYRGRGMRHQITTSLDSVDADTTTVRSVHEGYLTGLQRPLALFLRKAFRQRWRVEFAELCRYLERA